MHKLLKVIPAAACLLSASYASAEANVCTWHGGAGNGVWSDSANWDTLPQSGNGDTLVFDTSAGDIVACNDIADFDLAELQIVGSGHCTLNGEAVVFSRDISNKGKPYPSYNTGRKFNLRLDNFNADAPVTNTFNLPLKIANYSSVTFTTNSTHCQKVNVFNGEIAIGEGLWLELANQGTGVNNVYAYFNAPINGAAGSALMNDVGNGGSRGHADFNGPVNVSAFYADYAWGNRCPYSRFYAPTNRIDYFFASYQDGGAFYAANQFPETMWVELANGAYGEGAMTLAADQTIGRLTSDFKTEKKAGCVNATGKTLTLKATQSDRAWVRLNDPGWGSVNFVYAPLGDYTQVFTNVTDVPHSSSGFLEVQRGTLRFDGVPCTQSHKFKTIRVANGATFEWNIENTAATGSFSQLEEIRLGAAATFRIGTAETIATKKLVVAGVNLENGTYTASDYPQIQGSITVTDTPAGSITQWHQLAGGDFDLPENWTAGVPTAEVAAQIAAEGTYTVSLADPDLKIGALAVGTGLETATATLAVRGEGLIAGDTALTIGKGGRFEQLSGTLTISNTTAKTCVEKGGEWYLGGTATNRVSGNSQYRFTLASDAKLTVAGSACFRMLPNVSATYIQPADLNGDIEIRENGTMYAWGLAGEPEGTFLGSRIVCRDNARFLMDRPTFNSPDGGIMTFTLKDNAHFEALNGGAFFLSVRRPGSRAIFTAERGTTMKLLYMAGLAVADTCYAELNINAGATCSIGGEYGLYLAGINESYKKDNNRPCKPEAVLNCAGTLTVGNIYGGGNDGGDGHRGVTIAGGGRVKNGAYIGGQTFEMDCKAALNLLPGATCSFGDGQLAIGQGYGNGTFDINGATFEKKLSSNDKPRYVIVGQGPGTGLLHVHGGGTATFNDPRFFLGGCSTNDLNEVLAVARQATQPRFWEGFPDGAEATGTLKIGRGAVTLKTAFPYIDGKLFVAKQGTGAIAFYPEDGVFGKLTVDYAVEFGEKAEVTVDLGDYDGGSVRLTDFKGTVEGREKVAFAVRGAQADRYRLVWRGDNVRLVGANRGLSLRVR
ncbi:MAG: hypothetical protein ACI4RD_00055 [Kiritimatiellia bacterium]